MEREGRGATFLSRPRVVGLNQGGQRLQGNHQFERRDKRFQIVLLLGRDQLVIREAELFTTHHHIPDLQLQAHYRSGVPEFVRVSANKKTRFNGVVWKLEACEAMIYKRVTIVRQ